MSRKTVIPTLFCFGLFILGGIIYPAVSSLVDSLWGYLVYLFPDRLTTYNPITGGVGYVIYSCISQAMAVFATFLLIHYFALRCDNGRYEYTARLHDGRFHLPEGYRHYFAKYLTSDLVISLLPALTLTLPAALLPKRFMNTLLGVPFWSGGALVPHFGVVLALLLAAALSVLGRWVAVLLAVPRYRAAWLSGEM